MKKNLFVFLTALLLFSVMSKAQNNIVIGTGNSILSQPFCSVYNYSWCETIYPASEITTSGNITALAWDIANANAETYNTIQIYLGTRSDSVYSSSFDWMPMSELTLVYDATNVIIGTDTNWQTFTLDNPFFYDGIENLVVVVAKTTSHFCSSYCYCTDVPNTCLYRGSNNDFSCAAHPGSASGNLENSRANIMIFIAPTDGDVCLRPKNVTIGNITENSAQMQWLDTNALSWDIYLTSSETDIPDSNTVPTHYASTTSYDFQGLNPNTDYYAYVRANCEYSTFSSWKSAAFKTTQIAAQLPYSCDFEDSTENANWRLIGHNTNKWVLGTAVNNTPNGHTSLYVSNNNGASNNYTNTITSTSWAYRDIDLDSTYAEYELSFDFRGVGEDSTYDNLRVYIGPSATPAEASSHTGACPPGAVEIGNFHNESNWTRPTITLNSSYAGIKRLYFLWWNDFVGGNSPAAAVDNLLITGIDCGAPYDLTASAITGTSVAFTFHPASSSDNSWQAIAVAHGDTIDETQAVTLSTNAYVFSNLAANSSYDIYVRTDCGGAYSIWSQALEIHTNCTEFMAIPYTESFDAYGVGFSSYPLCWKRLYNTNNSVPLPYISDLYASEPGALSFSSYASNHQYSCAIAPQVDVSANPINTLSVVFKIMKISSSAGYGALQVGVMTNPNDITTFTPVRTFTGSEWANTDTWYDIEIPLVSYTGNGSYIALYTPDTTSGTTFVDDFLVYPTPSCERPSSITAVSTPTDVVNVSWVDNGGTMWDLIYAPTGFDPYTSPSAISVENLSTPYHTVSGLTAGVTYDFYVRRNCGNGNVSLWSNSPATIAPYTVFMGDTGSYSVTGCDLTIYDNGGMNGNYSNNCDYYLTIYPANPDSVVSVSGIIQAESATYDYLVVYNDVCNASTAANATQLYKSNQTSASSVLSFGPITSTSGPLTLYFHTDASAQHPGFVAHTSCVTGPPCRQPSQLISTGSTASSISLSWKENGSATTWNVAYGPSGFTPSAASTTTSANDTTITISGLTAGTSYDFYVQADCGGEYSDWTGPVTRNPGTYNMPVTGTHSISMCDGTVFDDGGLIDNYSNDCNSTLTIYPTDSNSYVSISGTFAGEGPYDYLSVYQGVAVDEGHLIQKITSPTGSSVTFGPFTSESGPLTLYFYSDHSNTYAGFAVNVSCVTAPSCRAPYDVIAQNVFETDAIVEWSMSSNNYVGFNVAISTSANFDPNTCSNVSYVSSTSYHFTGLSSNTTYFVSVQTDCGGGNVSDWSNILSFTTECDIVSSLPYIDNFDSYCTGNQVFPNCWSYISTFTDFPPFISGSCYSSPGAMGTYGDNTNEHIVITPEFDTSIPINTLQANFMYRATNATSGIVVGVMSDPTDASTFVPVQTINATTTGTWITTEVSFANYTGNGHFIAFRNNRYSYFYIDNLIINTIQTCLVPQNLTAAVTMDYSATLSWTETGSATSWDIEYGPAGFTQGQGTVVATSSNPFTLTGLSASTNYDAYVRANCGGAVSYWSLPTRFATLCGPALIPYMENFDAYPMTNSSVLAPDDYPNNPMPICWDILNRDNIAQVFLTTRAGCAVHGNCLLFTVSQNSPPAFAILSEFVNDIRDLEISFYLRKDGVNIGGQGIFMIGYLTDPNDTSTFVPTYTIENNDYASGMHHIQEITFDNAPIGSRIAFKCQSTYSYIYYTLDNVVVDLLPNCRKPHDVVASNATTHSIDVAWTEMGSATAWNIEYGPTGFTQGQGTVISANTNPFTVTGLASATLYDFYVRADCGAGETSSWADMASGVTDCDLVSIFPYTENFDATSSLPPCWYNIDMIGNTLWQVTTPNHGFVTLAHSGSHAAVFFQGNSGNETSLLLPPLDFTNLTNPVITFWYTNQTWSHDTDELYVYCRSSESDPWTLLASHTSGTSTWTFDSLSLPNPSATYQIKFQAISNWGYGINLDDITVKGDNPVLPTTCDIPRSLSASNGTTTGVTVTWLAGGSESEWNIQYKEVSDADWSGEIPVTTTSYDFTGLTPNTPYQVRVQAVCDATTTSDWTASVYFTTEEELVIEPCDIPTDLTATEINNHDITLSWTENGTATNWTIYYSIDSTEIWNTQPTTTNPYQLIGLEGNTSYNIFVVANCADDDTSLPSDTIHILTTNVGVNNYEAANVTVAPNPTTNVVKVQSSKSQISSVDVYDVYGKLLNTISANDGTVEVNLGQYTHGVYFLRISTGNGMVTKRVVKK